MNSNAAFYETKNTNQSADSYSGIGYADDTGNGGTMYVFNPYNNSSYTFMIAPIRFVCWNSFICK